jgi:hypothetical protein
MNQRGQNEGFRVLEDLVCEALPNPAIPQAPPGRRGQNEGVRVLEDFSLEIAEESNRANTTAEALTEEAERQGALRSRREDLLRLLRAKFHKVPEGVARRVEATEDVEQLKTWLDAVIPAKQLADVGITPLESGE